MSATFTIKPDIYPPEIADVFAGGDSTKVVVVFNEPVDATTANNKSNYSINNGITISAAAQTADQMSVTLTTSVLQAGPQYTLTATGISDQATTPNTLNTANKTFYYVPAMFDDFEDGGRLNWVPRTDSHWVITTNSGDMSYYLNTTNYTDDNEKPGEYTIFNDHTFSNFELEVECKSADFMDFANVFADYVIIFGHTDTNNFHYFMASRGEDGSQLCQVENGTRATLATVNEPLITSPNYHDVKVVAKNHTVTVYSGGEEKLFFKTPTIDGKVGLGSYNDAAYFDNFRVIPQGVAGMKDSWQKAVGNWQGLPITLCPNPMRDQVVFGTHGKNIDWITIYNNNGKVVWKIRGARQPEPLQWGGTDMAGNTVEPGVYFYSIKTNGMETAGRIIKTE
jgi:hypothetical protein